MNPHEKPGLAVRAKGSEAAAGWSGVPAAAGEARAAAGSKTAEQASAMPTARRQPVRHIGFMARFPCLGWERIFYSAMAFSVMAGLTHCVSSRTGAVPERHRAP